MGNVLIYNASLDKREGSKVNLEVELDELKRVVDLGDECGRPGVMVAEKLIKKQYER